MKAGLTKRFATIAALCVCASVAHANPSNLSAPWKLNGHGYPGDVVVQQAPDGTLGGSIYGEPLTGYYAPGERTGVWLRGAPSQPMQAFVGQASPDGLSFAGRMYGLNATTSGANTQRNVFAFSALRAAPAAPGNPGLPAAAAGPASVAGTLPLNANNIPGQLVLSQAPDGSLSGSIYGDRLAGHYAAGTGSIAFLRFTGTQPVQLYIGTVTSQGISGEFYALTVPAGGSAQRMRYTWSAQAPQLAQAPAIAPVGGTPAAAQAPFAADSGINGGALMASINEPTAAQCLARCRDMPGCTGFQFSAGSFGTAGRRSLPGASCLLYSGSVGLRPLQGVTACVMPCDGSAPKLAGKPFDPGTLRPVEPGNRVAAPGRLLPPRGEVAPAPTPPPPVGYIAPLAPKPGVVMVPALPAQPAAPAPAPSVARLSGFEIVVGPTARIAPLAISEAGVSCPPHKLAISVGYRVRPTNADPQYGVEVKAAWPEGSNARVRIRNANVLVPVEAEAIATCIDRHPGVRAVDTAVSTSSGRDLAAEAADCGNDRLIGGGFSGEMDAHQVVNAPIFVNKSDGVIGSPGITTFGFVSGSIKATPLPGSFKTSVRGICAPAGAVPDWEAVTGSLQEIGGRSSATLTLQCPTGKRMLSAGAAAGPWLRMSKQRPADGGPDQLAVWADGPTSWGGSHPIALIKNALEPQGARQPSGITLNGGGTAAFLSNRDIAGSSVRVLLAGVCATVP